MDDYSSSTTSYTTDFLFKYDAGGKLEWSTGDLGTSGKLVPLPDNRAIMKGDYHYSEKKADIKQIKPDGTIEPFASLEGSSIGEIRLRQSDNHLFASQGDKLSELDLTGKIVNTYQMDGAKAGMSVRSFENDGKVILQKETALYRWDPTNDSLASLTDHTMDYSYKVVLTDVSESEPEGPPKTVEKRDGEVIIGGVKLKVQK
jgi:hypothetical protein